MAGARDTHWADAAIARVTEDTGESAERVRARLEVWNPSTLAWDRMTQPSSGGGGGAATIADGADIAQGATTDASSANTVVGLLKAIKAAITGTLAVSGSLGRSWTLASGTDSVAATDGGGSLTVDAPVATPLWVRLSDGSAAFIGQKAMAASIPVVIASDQSSLPTTEARLPAALAGSGALKVDQQSALPAGTNTIGKVDQGAAGAARWLVDASGVAVPITDNAGSLTVDAADTTFGATVTPKAASVWDISDRVGRLLGVVSGGANVFHIDDNSGSVTVDAPVGTPLFSRLSDGAAALIGQKAAAAGLPVTLASDQTVVDNAGFTDGTTPLVMGGYIFDEVAGTALTENDGAAARVDSKRAVVNVLEDGTTRGTRATIKASGAAPASTDTALVVVNRDTPSEGTAIASASKAVGTYTFDIADTSGYSGICIVTDLTVLGASSTVTNSIQVKDPVTAKFATATAAAFTAINTVSTTRQAMHPANAGASGNLQGGVLTKAVRVNVVVATAASTLSVGYSLTP